VKPDQDIVDRQFPTENFDELLDDLVTEIKARNYRVTRINHIDNIYDRLEAGIDVVIGFKRYKIVEFCNLNSCSELISADLQAGVFMPVRYIVYQSNDENTAHIAFLKPTAFARWFDSKAVMLVATQLEEDMLDVLEEMVY
jgi:uncharacterized protein (DUF302 family)